AALTFTTMGYSVFAGVDVRGYGLLLFLLPLNLWLIVRWIAKPDWQRSIAVTIALTLILYVSFSSLILVPFLTLFILLARPKIFFYWIGIVLTALILGLPILPQFVQNNVLGRLNTLPLPMPEFFGAISGIFSSFGGATWFLVLVTAALLSLIVV